MKHSRTNDFILLFDGWIAEEDTFLNYIRFDQCSKKIAAGDSSWILSWTSRHFFSVLFWNRLSKFEKWTDCFKNLHEGFVFGFFMDSCW